MTPRPVCPRSGEGVPAEGRLCRRCGAGFGGEAWFWCRSGAPDAARTATEDGEDGERQVGPWRLGELLGHGGAGVVYAATHVDSGQAAAVKLLLSGLAATPRQLARFQRELRTQGALDDPDVVAILDSGTSPEGAPWVAMERVAGPSLAELLHEGQPLSHREAAALVTRLARCLARLHAMGIFHRDIKPSNVLLTEAGAPKLADFGLVLDPEASVTLTRAGQAPGTPRYMAPEQRSAQVEDWALVDVYALGLILGELLEAGERSFTLSGSAHPTPPAELLHVAQRATAEDPKERTPSAAALAEDLEQWRAGAPMRWRLDLARWRARGWLKRRRPLLLPLGLALGVVGLALTPGLIDRRQASQRGERAAERWQHLRPQLERHPDAARFAGFVEDIEHLGTAAVADAWLWQAAQARGAEASRAAARAVRLAARPEQRLAGLGLLATGFVERGDWEALARLDPLLPSDPERQEMLTFSFREHNTLAVLEPFQTAQPSETCPGRVTGAPPVRQTPDIQGAPTRREGELWLPAPCVVHEAGLACGPEVWTHAPQPEPLIGLDVAPSGLVEADGALYYGANDQRHLLWRALAGPDEAVHPETELLMSYVNGLATSDLDQDGHPELVLALGQPYGYGLRAVELSPSGPEPVATLRLGFPTGVAALDTPAGPRLALLLDDRVGSEGLFGAEDPTGGPTRVALVAGDEGGWRVSAEALLPASVERAEALHAVDLDGDGTDELLVTAKATRAQGPRPTAFIFTQDGRGGLQGPLTVPEVWVMHPVEADGDPGAELCGVAYGDGERRDVIFGVGEPLPPLRRPPPAPLEGAALLSALGQHEEAALAHEVRGEWAQAAEAWREAGELREASLAAESAGDLDLAARLAAEDFDFERAASLAAPDPRWPLGPPADALALDRPSRAQTHPVAVTHNLADQRLLVRSANGAGELLRVPLEVTGPAQALELELDWTHGEWASRLLILLEDEAGEELARVMLTTGGSGGALGRSIHAGLSWSRSVQGAAQASSLRALLTPGGVLVEVDGERALAHPLQARRPGADELLRLVLRAEDGRGHYSELELKSLRTWGMHIGDAQPWPQDALLSWAQGAGPLPPERARSAEALALMRLQPELLRGAPDPAQAFAELWESVAWNHPRSPALLSALEGEPRWADMDPSAASTLLTARAAARWREGELEAARGDLRRALSLSSGDPRAWPGAHRAQLMLAKIALSAGDVQGARAHAEAAMALAPDPDLGWRLLGEAPALRALLEEGD